MFLNNIMLLYDRQIHDFIIKLTLLVRDELRTSQIYCKFNILTNLFLVLTFSSSKQ